MRRSRGARRINREWSSLIKRSLVYGAVMFLLAVAENSFFGNLHHLPATPELVLAAVSVIAFTDSREAAMISAITGGIMTDAICGTGIYLSPILYFGVALLISGLSKKMIPRYPSWLAVLPMACAFLALFGIARTYIFDGGAKFLELLLHTILPEFIFTVIFSLPLYPLIKLSVKPFGSKQRNNFGA